MNAYSNFRSNVVYASTARFDEHARALTEDEMRAIAPSIFAVDKHESRSQRFQPIPTIEILRGLINEGFSPVAVRQGGSRDEEKRNFTKHMIRLRRLDDTTKYTVGDTVFEMILKNANDGTAAYDLIGGLFKIRCKNSLVTQIGTLDSVKVRHSGTLDGVQGKVIQGTYKVLNTAQYALAAPQDWSTIALNRDEQMAMAEAAHVLRFGANEDETRNAPTVDNGVSLTSMIQPRRHADTENNFWTQFNVLQENVIRGGLRGRSVNPETHEVRRTSTREIKNIDQDIKLNKALWLLGERMAELKGVKSTQMPESAAA